MNEEIKSILRKMGFAWKKIDDMSKKNDEKKTSIK